MDTPGKKILTTGYAERMLRAVSRSLNDEMVLNIVIASSASKRAQGRMWNELKRLARNSIEVTNALRILKKKPVRRKPRERRKSATKRMK